MQDSPYLWFTPISHVWFLIESLEDLSPKMEGCKESALPFRSSQPWNFPGGPMVKHLSCSAGGMGLIPGWVTGIPHALGQLSLCHNHRACAPRQKPLMPQLRADAAKQINKYIFLKRHSLKKKKKNSQPSCLDAVPMEFQNLANLRRRQELGLVLRWAVPSSESFIF